MTEIMTVPLDITEMKLIEECCLYEPWLEDNLRRARKKKKDGCFLLTLEGDEQRDVLSALEASAHFARQDGQEEKSIDCSVLHDKIIFFTPDEFVIVSRDFPERKTIANRKPDKKVQNILEAKSKTV